MQKIATVRAWTYGALTVPWCCVISIGSIFVATSSTIGIWVDEIFHKILPLLLFGHAVSILVYFRSNHQTRLKTVFMILTTLLFMASVAFHGTSLHDEIIHSNHDSHHR